jgi:shikimate kinase
MSVIYPGRNVVLIGMMGAGKSVVAEELAGRLGRELLDTDAMVEDELGKPIPEIFAEDGGERRFREAEAMMCRHVGTLRGRVVAVGGGAVTNPENVTALRATGDLVWLDADPEVISERVGDGTDRPLLADAEDVSARVRELHRRRWETYRRASALKVDTTDRTVADLAGEILAWAQRQPGLLAREETERIA